MPKHWVCIECLNPNHDSNQAPNECIPYENIWLPESQDLCLGLRNYLESRHLSKSCSQRGTITSVEKKVIQHSTTLFQRPTKQSPHQATSRATEPLPEFPVETDTFSCLHCKDNSVQFQSKTKLSADIPGTLRVSCKQATDEEVKEQSFTLLFSMNKH